MSWGDRGVEGRDGVWLVGATDECGYRTLSQLPLVFSRLVSSEVSSNHWDPAEV